MLTPLYQVMAAKLSFTLRTHVVDVPWDLTGPLSPSVEREDEGGEPSP